MSTRDRFATPSQLREGAWASRLSSREVSRTPRQVLTRSYQGTLPRHLSDNETRIVPPRRRRLQLGRCLQSLHARQQEPQLLLTFDRAVLSSPWSLLLCANALQPPPRLLLLSD